MRFLPFLLLCCTAYGAQHGGVVKAGEQTIPGASVTAVQGTRQLITSTDETGRYSLDLGPGEWMVSVQMFGFERAEQTVQPDTTVEWVLRFVKPAATAAKPPVAGFEVVEMAVIADDPAPEPVSGPEPTADSEEQSFLVNGSVSQGLSAPNEEDLGYVARLVQAESQVTAPPPGMGGAPAEDKASRTPGAKRAGRAAALVGKLSPEQRGKLAKRLKQRGGVAAVVNSLGNRRRRGQPGVRGMAFYTAGNSALDARPFSITGLSFEKPQYAQNRFGVTLGGPLRIPKLVDLSRTFFTFSYSGTRHRGPYNSFGTVPTAAERSGDFSQSQVRGPVAIYDPASGAPFPENRIPASRVHSAASGLMRYIPLPNQSGAVQNYQYVTSFDRNSDQLSLRMNQSISQKNRLTGGFSKQARFNENPHLFGWSDEADGRGYTADLGWAFTLGPKKIHDFRVRVNRDRNQTTPWFAFRENVAAELGIAGPSRSPLTWGPPNLNFTNFADLSAANPILRRNQNVSLIDSVSIVHNGHTLQSGIEFRWAQINTNTDQNARGQFTFSGLLTSALTDGHPTPGTGFDFADFLLGFPQSSSIRYGAANTYFRSRVYAGWLQDEWRVRPNLTLNLGVRYEYYSPFYEKFGRLANLDVAPGFTGVALVTPDQPGPYTGEFPRGMVEPDPNNIAPRIGFAWRPFSKKRTQLRGGYSQFYDGSTYGNIAVRLAAQPPFASTANIQTSLQRRLTLDNGFGTTGESGKRINNSFAVSRYYRVPYGQTWNFAVQHEIGQSVVVELGYTGTKGTRLDVLRLPNRAAPGSPLTAEQRRLIGNAVGFTFNSSEGNSIFHSGQLRITRRLKKGVSLNAAYTLSKSIDNASSVGGAGNVVAQNDHDLSAERGLSVFDQRHNLTVTNMISSPFGETAFWLRGKSWVTRLLKDWNLATSLTARSGRPFTARVLGNIADAGGTGAVGSGRADATGLPVTAAPGFFNPDAFTTPPAGRFGNAGRNTIPGPSFTGVNVSLGRTFDLDNRRKFEFRISTENFTNHVNLTGIATVVNATNYGLPTAAGSMRQVTMTMRLRF